MALQFGTADKALLAQFTEALEVGRRQIPVGGRCRQLRLGSSHVQLVVLRVQLRQHLAGLDALPQRHRAPDNLARHPKPQLRLDAGPHFAGEFGVGVQAVFTYHQGLDRAQGFLSGLGPGTCPQQNKACQQHGSEGGGVVWHRMTWA